MNVVKEVILITNISLVISIFILNSLVLIFRQDISVLSLTLGENIAIVIINVIMILVCKLGDK